MIKNKKRVSKGVFKVLTGVVVGGAIGSILGLTLAPEKGKKTRQIIRDKSMKLYLKSKKDEPQKPKVKLGPLKKTAIKLLKPKKKYENKH